jgi:hypothetical protein
MSQTWKIVIAVIITAIVVGGGVYLWQSNRGEELPASNSKLLEENPQTPIAGLECDFNYQCENKVNCKSGLMEGCVDNLCQCAPEVNEPVIGERCVTDSWCEKGLFSDCIPSYRQACDQDQGICGCKLK